MIPEKIIITVKLIDRVKPKVFVKTPKEITDDPANWFSGIRKLCQYIIDHGCSDLAITQDFEMYHPPSQIDYVSWKAE